MTSAEQKEREGWAALERGESPERMTAEQHAAMSPDPTARREAAYPTEVRDHVEWALRMFAESATPEAVDVPKLLRRVLEHLSPAPAAEARDLEIVDQLRTLLREWDSTPPSGKTWRDLEPVAGFLVEHRHLILAALLARANGGRETGPTFDVPTVERCYAEVRSAFDVWSHSTRDKRDVFDPQVIDSAFTTLRQPAPARDGGAPRSAGVEWATPRVCTMNARCNSCERSIGGSRTDSTCEKRADCALKAWNRALATLAAGTADDGARHGLEETRCEAWRRYERACEGAAGRGVEEENIPTAGLTAVLDFLVPLAARPAAAGGNDGVALIAKERKRQVEQEGWTPEHDNQHEADELALAAALYAVPTWLRDDKNLRDVLWPYSWALDTWKPSPDNRIRELVKAGALIAAEIDRLQRSTPAAG